MMAARFCIAAPFLRSCVLLPGDSAQRQTLHQPPSYGEAGDDHGQHHDGAYRHELTPVDARLGYELRGGDRERLAAGAGETRREGVVVPGEHEAEDGRGYDAG